MIPPPHDKLAFGVFSAIAEGNAADALTRLDTALQSGRTVDRFCGHLIEHVRTMMMLRVCGDETDLVDVASQQREQLVAQARSFDAPTYVYMISLLEELRRNAKTSGASRALAEAAVVRLAMSHQFSDITDLLEQLGGDASSPSQSKKKEHS